MESSCASLLDDQANARFATGDIEMLTTLEILTLSAVIVICVVATWTTRQQPPSMSQIFGAPSIVRSVPESGFGGARSFLREEEDPEALFGPFS
jgi:hypothetical protein